MDHKQNHNTQSRKSHSMHKKYYRQLIIMAMLSFIAMYILMYSIVDRLSNIIVNLDQFYMAAIKTAPMIIIMILLMRYMFMNKKLDLTIFEITIAAGAAWILFIRKQTGVSDKEFMKAMISHHAGTILMVKQIQTKLKNP